jgi:hypothetical protein
LDLQLNIAPNDKFGVWTIQVVELASGQTDTTYFEVPAGEAWPPAVRPPSDEITNPEQSQG